MSTINKILKTIGVAAVCDVIGAGVIDIEVKVIKKSHKSSDETTFANYFFANVFLTTLPALVAFGVDKFVNQNITSNKTIQYGLTAFESVLATLTILSVLSSFPKHYEDLSDLDFCIEASILIQSLAFKYIWDSSDEATPELNQIVDLDALNVSADFGSL